MKVILKKEIKGLGRENDIVEVKNGYGRNFLIPRGLVLKATPGNLKIIEEEKKRGLRKKEKEKGKYQDLAKKLKELSCTITTKAGGDEKLYGSVTAGDIAEALTQKGVQLDKKMIELTEPIKMLGVYQVAIKLHPEVKTTVKVWVIKE